MIGDDFKIDFESKKIYHIKRGVGKIYTANELYSYLQDVFDEPDKMEYEIPIKALSSTQYSLINGWTIDKESLKYIKGKIEWTNQTYLPS